MITFCHISVVQTAAYNSRNVCVYYCSMAWNCPSNYGQLNLCPLLAASRQVAAALLAKARRALLLMRFYLLISLRYPRRRSFRGDAQHRARNLWPQAEEVAHQPASPESRKRPTLHVGIMDGAAKSGLR